ncbi:beta-galactosidase [Desertihabitans brevis]|uniref:beta-galactosidase n=1 Tax=Desertihabitans brevis TaxID=2268447 RepID=UPI0013147E03|nr:beta-galactosidase [Desertihabitans brevis]
MAEPTLWIGADWNPEQWPRDVWRTDVELMVRAGVNLATVGVFSWSSLEPRPDEWRIDWLVDVLDLLHEHGVRADLATPTASPPPWLARLWPETSAVTAEGVRLSPFSRNHFCPTSAVYRERCAAVVQALLDRCAGHPAVALWHVGNEFGQTCFCDSCAAAFRVWLRERYGDLDGLNRAWGTAVWSQGVGDWDDVLPPRAAPYLHNPAQLLDFRRFASDAQLELFRAQRDQIRSVDATTPVTTNFMGFFAGVDYRRWARELDLVSDDSYPDPSRADAVVDSAMSSDLMRSLGGDRGWMLMEQAASTVNFRPHNAAKSPARLRREVFQAVARGARGLCWFQWHQAAQGPERFHSALLPAAGTDTRHHRMVAALGTELAGLPDLGEVPRAEVALLFDWPSWWAGTQRDLPSDRLDPLAQLRRWYRVCWQRGVLTDVLGSGDALDGVRLLLAPSAVLLDDATVARLRAWVRDGGHLWFGPFASAVDETTRLRQGPFPSGFADLLGVRGEEWHPLPDDQLDPDADPSRSADPDRSALSLSKRRQSTVALVPTDLGAGLPRGRADIWAEWLEVDSADVWARFQGGPADGGPAVLTSAAGAGRVGLVSTVPDAALLDAVLGRALDLARVAVPPAVPDVERVVRGGLTFLINHGQEVRTVPVPGATTDLLSGTRYRDAVELHADEVRVLTKEEV